MNFIYEIFPVFLFFLAFKFYDIYIATLVGIVATVIQVLLGRIMKGRWEPSQVVTLAVFLVFGGLTLYFHNPIFIKWKPTLVFWIFSIVIFASHFFGKKSIAERLLTKAISQEQGVPFAVWKKLNFIWGLFFALLGGVNLYIAYQFSSNAWVNFKFYGLTSAILLFSLFQAVYLMNYIQKK